MGGFSRTAHAVRPLRDSWKSLRGGKRFPRRGNYGGAAAVPPLRGGFCHPHALPTGRQVRCSPPLRCRPALKTQGGEHTQTRKALCPRGNFGREQFFIYNYPSIVDIIFYMCYNLPALYKENIQSGENENNSCRLSVDTVK